MLLRRYTPLVAAGVFLVAFSLNSSGFEQPTDSPSFTDEQKEEFLRNAEVVNKKSIKTGITGTTRLTMTWNGITHDAHLQCIDEKRDRFETPMGTEINFRDCYKFNIAAYKLDRLIRQYLVPVSIERKILGKMGAVTWWVDNVQMMEKDRYKKEDPGSESGQMERPDLPGAGVQPARPQQ